jgi:hypothetical protein
MPKRTAKTIEELVAASENRRKVRSENGKKYGTPNLKPFKPGQSGNPGGRPKNDRAKDIAQAIFENDAEAIYTAFARALRNGGAYAFSVLADRAYGKIKETREITGAEGAPLEITVKLVKPSSE